MRAVGVGELLWDLLPGGPRLGGAPFNVVAHLRRLGWDTAYVSAVGSDELGRRSLDELSRLGVDPRHVAVAGVPTGIVRVELEAGVPRFEIVSPAAYEAVAAEAARSVGPFDLLVFGTLAQRFDGVRAATRDLAESRPQSIRLYDVNLREGCWTPALVDELLALASVLKLNDGEAAVLARELSLPDASIEEFARAAAERHALDAVCITRGAEGASLLLDGRFVETAVVPVAVVDTVGAGDAFSAGLAAGLVSGRPAEQILAFASRLAALVSSRAGAIPDWQPYELSTVGDVPAEG